MRLSRRIVTSLVCLFSLYLIFCSTVWPSSSGKMQEESPELLKYEIRDVYIGSLKHVIRIINHSPTPVRGELFIPVIKNETARRYVILQNVSLSKVDDSSGNIYYHRNDLIISEGQTFSIELNYYVVSFDIRYLISSSLVKNYDTRSDLYKKYTEPEELIECNCSKIISLARNLTDNVDCWHEKSLKIYNFVRRHIHYKVQDEERGALWALENGVGDCSEYSYLFVALCRSAGIPARIQAGFAFHHTRETLEDGHMWAEYYLESYGWIPVDVTWRLFDKIDDKHFSSIQSIPEAIPYANYVFDCEEENVEDEQTVSLKPCSTDVSYDSFIENTVSTIQKMGQTRFIIFLGRIFGTSLIFPSDLKMVEQKFLEGEFQLQNALDSLDEKPQIVESNVVHALENIEKALQDAWMLIIKVIVIFISIPIALMLIGLFFLKRNQNQTE